MKRNGMFKRSEFLLTWSDHYSAPVLYENEILMLLEDDKEASIVCRYLAYKKKEDFMFSVCMNEKQTKEQQEGVWDNLRLDEDLVENLNWLKYLFYMKVSYIKCN